MSKSVGGATVGPDSATIGRGIALMLFAGLAFSLSFAFIKELGPEMPTSEIMLFRMGVGLLPMLPLLLRAPKGILKTDRPFGHVYRVSVGFTSMALLYWALPRMPLVDLTATQFTMPLFLTVLSVPLLKEAVGWRRAIATLFGFGGVMIMLNPGETGVSGLDIAYFVALGSAFFYALAAIAMRQLGATEPALRTTIYFSSVAAIAGGIGCLFDWVDPTMKELALLVGTGLVGGLGQYALVSAYKMAPATIVAPFDYSQLLWATILGFLIWQETPSSNALLGAAILAAAGIYIFRREAVARRR
ncbi:MAG: DMT family transporter [Alphaproteobacteria bacterium]